MISNFSKILDIFTEKLIPLSDTSINSGNKIFGAFIVKKSDLSLVCMGANEETKNPLLHGEISALFKLDETQVNQSLRKDGTYINVGEHLFYK